LSGGRSSITGAGSTVDLWKILVKPPFQVIIP
jgi:hypothetical protein